MLPDTTDKDLVTESRPSDVLGGRSRSPTIRDEVNEEAQNNPKHDKNDDNHSDPDVLIVDWEGQDDPSNPQNWPTRRKWATTIVVSFFTFISPVSSSMSAPAAGQISKDFHITNSATTAMITSIFVLGYAIGPLLVGPLSEVYGRSRVLRLSNLFYLVWNLACGFSQNASQLIAFRFLSGIGGGAPIAIGGGAIGDIWRPEERGKAIAIYSLTPLLGPVIGPLCGAWIAQRSTWRWVYWSTSIIDTIVQLVGSFYLRETYAPVLLLRKAKHRRRNLDSEKGQVQKILTVYEKDDPRSWKQLFVRAIFRPFAFLALEPIVLLIGLYFAFTYGLMYLVLTSMPLIFHEVYHEAAGTAGLHYAALGIGLASGAYSISYFLDRIYIYLTKKNGGVGEPEFRLPCSFAGVMMIPAGLLISGWAAQTHTHWVVTDIGIALIGGGINTVFLTLQTYIIDAFTLHAASAIGAAIFLQSLAGFGFPLFGPAMYRSLGYGKANTILACLGVALGSPGPWIFWTYGKRIRAASRYARK